MSITAIKAAIIARLNTLDDPGQVVDFPGAEMDAEASGAFTGFFTSVTRGAVEQARRTMGGRQDRIHQIQIDVYLPMDVSSDAGASANEAKFDARIDAILQLFSDGPNLGGLIGRSDPPQATEDANGIRFYRGAVQCRYRRITWAAAENAAYAPLAA
jgi:peptidoglycan hydrolase-like protein with peptidoglycan-binding domain